MLVVGRPNRVFWQLKITRFNVNVRDTLTLFCEGIIHCLEYFYDDFYGKNFGDTILDLYYHSA